MYDLHWKFVMMKLYRCIWTPHVYFGSPSILSLLNFLCIVLVTILLYYYCIRNKTASTELNEDTSAETFFILLWLQDITLT